MKTLSFLLLITLYATKATAQNSPIGEFDAIDKRALQLPDSLSTTTDDIAQYFTTVFKTDSEKSRAIFVWIATHIEYDIENMFALNFYEAENEKILKPLKTTKGICANFAALFNEICSKSGIPSYVVEGYTKQNGFADYIPHAWCAARIDGQWFIFDPTWGSGFASKGKFVQHLNNAYYKADPASIIKSHMPFDYLWQFLNYPVTQQEFYEGKTAIDKSKPYFNFIDSIRVFEKQAHLDRLASESRRIEINGVKNSLIFDRLFHLKQERIVTLYNGSVTDYNDGVNRLNEFINYRNKQFRPVKPDSEIQAMIDTSMLELNDSKALLLLINPTDENTSKMIAQLMSSIDEASKRLNEEQEWLKRYFSKSKAFRRTMFYKVSWFGTN